MKLLSFIIVCKGGGGGWDMADPIDRAFIIFLGVVTFCAIIFVVWSTWPGRGK